MEPSSALRARKRWRFGWHRHGCIPSAVSEERRKEPRLKVGEPPTSPRRDAVPDDARGPTRLPNRHVAFEHAMEIGTREPIWTGHDVGSRCADHGQKREPGEGHKTLSKHENDAVGHIEPDAGILLRASPGASRPGRGAPTPRQENNRLTRQ